MEKETCEKRIDKELKYRIENFKEILKDEDPLSRINEESLAFSKKVVYTLELSTGGPGDYVEFEYDTDTKRLIGITYYYLDWFDSAKREIKENSEEWRVLEEVFNLIHPEE
ncbi:MAG: hypothetical protein JTT12_05685 [Candidatus Brockarchaeota archaeon]|nr:hypothetical protein [Candidatus Brockarchaeota archaeon]